MGGRREVRKRAIGGTRCASSARRCGECAWLPSARIGRMHAVPGSRVIASPPPRDGRRRHPRAAASPSFTSRDYCPRTRAQVAADMHGCDLCGPRRLHRPDRGVLTVGNRAGRPWGAGAGGAAAGRLRLVTGRRGLAWPSGDLGGTVGGCGQPPGVLVIAAIVRCSRRRGSRTGSRHRAGPGVPGMRRARPGPPAAVPLRYPPSPACRSAPVRAWSMLRPAGRAPAPAVVVSRLSGPLLAPAGEEGRG